MLSTWGDKYEAHVPKTLIFVSIIINGWQVIFFYPGVELSHRVCWQIRIFPEVKQPHQWQNGNELKAGRREVPGSNPVRTCWPSCLEFSVFFFETCVNTGWDSLERPPQRAFPYRPRSHKWIIALKLTNQPNLKWSNSHWV